MNSVHFVLNHKDSDMVEVYFQGWSKPMLGCVLHIDALNNTLSTEAYNLLVEEGEVKVNLVEVSK